jgi:hypothetical protein
VATTWIHMSRHAACVAIRSVQPPPHAGVSDVPRSASIFLPSAPGDATATPVTCKSSGACTTIGSLTHHFTAPRRRVEHRRSHSCHNTMGKETFCPLRRAVSRMTLASRLRPAIGATLYLMPLYSARRLRWIQYGSQSVRSTHSSASAAAQTR